MSIHDKSLAINGGTPVRTKPLMLQVPFLDDEDAQSVLAALKTTFISGDGPSCREFEKLLAEYLGVKHAFFVVSATAALDLAFMIKEFPAGSEVLVPNFTYTSTALGPILNGLKVVLVDVYADHGNIDISKIEKAITEKTVAIMPVDYAGNPADMDPINEIARRYKLYVVHDTAQSIGATYKGKKTGALAEVSTFSFHGTKNLVTGEGGAFVTDSDELAQKIIMAREKGTDKHSFISDAKKKGFYEYVVKGNSYVQSNILAALGVSQIRKIDHLNARRKQIAEHYIANFTGYGNIGMPVQTANATTNWHLFYLRVPKEHRLWIIDALKAEGIAANVHYTPLHLNQYYRNLAHDDLENSVKFFHSLVRIPLYPSLTDGDVEDIVAGVKKVLDRI